MNFKKIFDLMHKGKVFFVIYQNKKALAYYTDGLYCIAFKGKSFQTNVDIYLDKEEFMNCKKISFIEGF